MNEMPDFEKLEELLVASFGSNMDAFKESMPEFTGDDLESFYTIAYDFYENGKYKEATNFFRFLTTFDNTKKKLWIGLGASLQMQKEYEKAINAYSIAALLEGKDPYIPFYAAECCFSSGNTERGMEALDAAEELAADDDKFKGLRKQLSALREAWSNPQ